MKIKKAILTGGGRATRLHPITTTINKHLLPLANKPMIFHAIEKVVDAGIEEIYINTNPGETSLQEKIGDGGHWGVNITYFEQTGGPLGVAHVPKQAEHLIGNEPFLFYLSDNILLGDVVKEMVMEFKKDIYDCLFATTKVDDPKAFGVAVFDKTGNIVDVLEKPPNPPSNMAVTGLYIYGPGFFFNAFEKIKKSDRGEYEISSIHSVLLREGKRVGSHELTGWWKDTGKPSDLLKANQLLLERMPGGCSKKTDKIYIGEGTTIGKNVRITGPVVIGENCILTDCYIGPNVSIGSGSEIHGSTVKDSIVLENAYIKGELKLGGCLIGKNSRVVQNRNSDSYQRMIIGDKTTLEL